MLERPGIGVTIQRRIRLIISLGRERMIRSGVCSLIAWTPSAETIDGNCIRPFSDTRVAVELQPLHANCRLGADRNAVFFAATGISAHQRRDADDNAQAARATGVDALVATRTEIFVNDRQPFVSIVQWHVPGSFRKGRAEL